jgi:hypothetical protein
MAISDFTIFPATKQPKFTFKRRTRNYLVKTSTTYIYKKYDDQINQTTLYLPLKPKIQSCGLNTASKSSAACEEEHRCYYCGLKADTVDHVVPQSMLTTLSLMTDKNHYIAILKRHQVLTVTACRECNCIIGNKYFDTLQRRKEYIKERLKIRHRKLLNAPDWHYEKIREAELEGRAKNYMEVMQIRKEITEERLRF